MMLNANKRARLGLWAALCLVPLACSAGDGLPARYVAGEHYTELGETVAKEAAAERVQVIEFFLYSCPHCYHLDAEIESWSGDLKKGVEFRRVPVTFSGAGPVYAQIFYTAKVLGVLEAMHTDIFKAIHEQDRRLTEVPDIRAFFVEHGVTVKAFDQAFGSDHVKRQVRAADKLMRAFNVASVPSIGVAGRYWVSVRQAGDNQAMLDVSDYLIQRVLSK